MTQLESGTKCLVTLKPSPLHKLKTLKEKHAKKHFLFLSIALIFSTSLFAPKGDDDDGRRSRGSSLGLSIKSDLSDFDPQEHAEAIISFTLNSYSTANLLQLMLQAFSNTARTLWGPSVILCIDLAPVDAHLAPLGDRVQGDDHLQAICLLHNALAVFISALQQAALKIPHNNIDARVIALIYTETLADLVIKQLKGFYNRNHPLLAAIFKIDTIYLEHCLGVAHCPALGISQLKHLNIRQLDMLAAFKPRHINDATLQRHADNVMWMKAEEPLKAIGL